MSRNILNMLPNIMGSTIKKGSGFILLKIKAILIVEPLLEIPGKIAIA